MTDEPEASTIEEYQTEKGWLGVRREAVGASEAPIVLGISPYGMSPLKLYAQKIGKLDPEPQTEAQRWGLLQELPMAIQYAEETGHTLRDPRERGTYALHRSRHRPWMVATLDREIVKADDQPVPAVLELKTRRWVPEGLWEDEPPADVLVQVQHQLAVTGWQWAAVAVLIAGAEFRRFVVPRHEDFIAKLIVAERAFHERVMDRRPPAPDASEATREALLALYPEERRGLTVTLPVEAEEWDAQRLHANEILKRATDLKTEAENHLRALIGEAETAILPNGVRYSYRATERKGYVVQPTMVRTLRRHDPK